jgi:hypothetical protein
MIRRCHNPDDKQYGDYGGRGIVVVQEWHDFHTFCVWALANGAQKGKHLDRENNDGPYSPDNCRYVTPTVNANNKRNNHLLAAFGETKTIANWARDPRCVVIDSTIRRRMQAGWAAEDALTLKRASQRLNKPCKNGHNLATGGVYIRKSGYNVCATCARERAKDQYHKNK